MISDRFLRTVICTSPNPCRIKSKIHQNSRISPAWDVASGTFLASRNFPLFQIFQARWDRPLQSPAMQIPEKTKLFSNYLCHMYRRIFHILSLHYLFVVLSNRYFMRCVVMSVFDRSICVIFQEYLYYIGPFSDDCIEQRLSYKTDIEITPKKNWTTVSASSKV